MAPRPLPHVPYEENAVKRHLKPSLSKGHRIIWALFLWRLLLFKGDITNFCISDPVNFFAL